MEKFPNMYSRPGDQQDSDFRHILPPPGGFELKSISILLGHFVKTWHIFFNFYPISNFSSGIRYHIQSGHFLVQQFMQFTFFHAENEEGKMRILRRKIIHMSKCTYSESSHQAELKYAHPVTWRSFLRPQQVDPGRRYSCHLCQERT